MGNQKLFVSLILCLVYQTQALYPSSSDVVELTAANFDRLVIQSDAIWVVEFFAPWCGHCQQLVPEYSKAAVALKGVVKVGAVNADEHKSLGSQYGVRGFPTIKIFGANKQKPDDYNDQRTAKAITDAALAAVRRKVNAQLTGKADSKDSKKSDENDVIELTESNFEKLVLKSNDIWLVEFFAPWCGHCKNLAPHWAKAATELKGKVKLGAVDATVHSRLASEYQIQGYPTIKYFPAGSKDSGSAEEYDGGRTSPDIVRWAMEKFEENVPAPELNELINENVLNKCKDAPLCVFTILPHILDCQSQCRNEYLNMLRTLGEKYKKKQWSWVWTEALAQPDVENVLELGGFGYPTMAVVNFKKMKFSTFKGSFSKDGIDEFLRDLSFGRGQTAPVKGSAIPKIKEIQAWDGKDGQLIVDEDIDLSDVDLDEKDEL